MTLWGHSDVTFPRLKIWASTVCNSGWFSEKGWLSLSWAEGTVITQPGITYCAPVPKLRTWTQEIGRDVGTHKYIQCLVRSDICTLAHWNQSKCFCEVLHCDVRESHSVSCDCNTKDIVDTLPIWLRKLACGSTLFVSSLPLWCPYVFHQGFWASTQWQ